MTVHRLRTVIQSMSEAVENSSSDELTEEQVAEYLRRNKDFFARHEYLLKELTVPHASGKAISLGERQVQVFREHRDGLQDQLNELIEVARENDQHFEKSKRLLLNLLEVKTLDEIDIVVREAFKNDKNIDFTSVIVFGDSKDYPISDIHLVSNETARDKLGALLDSNGAICGQFSPVQLECLFPTHSAEVASAGVIPLRNGEALGMFCLGSKSKSHFDSSMGSLFLSYISDFISRILPDLLIKSRSNMLKESVPSLLD